MLHCIYFAEFLEPVSCKLFHCYYGVRNAISRKIFVQRLYCCLQGRLTAPPYFQQLSKVIINNQVVGTIFQSSIVYIYPEPWTIHLRSRLVFIGISPVVSWLLAESFYIFFSKFSSVLHSSEIAQKNNSVGQFSQKECTPFECNLTMLYPQHCNLLAEWVGIPFFDPKIDSNSQWSI